MDKTSFQATHISKKILENFNTVLILMAYFVTMVLIFESVLKQ